MRLLILVLMLPISSCWVMRAYKVRNMNLTDHQKLSSVDISRSNNPFQYHSGLDPGAYSHITAITDSLIDQTSTAAFLIIRNDSILYEYYGMGFNSNTILPSNSMAKSFTGTLAGIAIEEAAIKSINDPITNYLPELAERDERFSSITIQHLLNMRTGLDFNEGKYNLCDDAVQLGFRPNLEKHILKAQIKKAP